MIVFMISDGKGAYLRRDANGYYSAVRNKALGTVWDSREKANNILHNCVNKNLRYRYNVVEIDDKPAQSEVKNSIIPPKPKPQPTIQLDGSVAELKRKIEQISDIICGTEARKNELTIALSNIDKELTDLDHSLELNNMNAYQGYLYAKIRKRCLEKRRKIKDELAVLVWLGDCKVTEVTLHDIVENIQGLDNRKYQPRVLMDLFTDVNLTDRLKKIFAEN